MVWVPGRTGQRSEEPKLEPTKQTAEITQSTPAIISPGNKPYFVKASAIRRIQTASSKSFLLCYFLVCIRGH